VLDVVGVDVAKVDLVADDLEVVNGRRTRGVDGGLVEERFGRPNDFAIKASPQISRPGRSPRTW
jgi:hypothetical protein